MAEERPLFLQKLEKHDPEMAKLVGEVREKVLKGGALDAKTKTLMVMAIDAAAGHPGGVASLSKRARALGASQQEIVEALRLAFLASGASGVITGLAAFDE